MNHQINYNWYNEPFAVSRIDLFILRHAWLNLWDKRMLLAESTRLLSVESIYTLREYAILTTSQTSKTILRCRRRQTYSCVLRTLHQERYFWFSPSFTKDRTNQVQKCWWLNEFLTLRRRHGCRNDPMFVFVVFEICVWLYVLRWIGVVGFRWEMRTVIFKFFKSSIVRISPHYLNNHFETVKKSLQIFIVYQLCLNKSAEAVVCWVKCQHRLSQLRTDLHLFPSWFWVRIYYHKIHEKI